ncbi:PAS domain-containing hybrid sensor histidine kinase/response regulator [Caenimonas sedimenti]|uniref:PAS domain-containing hybrid sensor histidine kinase/response regulator n=1 Tax=Caenimonas sedimenti TaxID=2596921 RepID=UPI0021022ED4|nr:ATP-binding protein [Caenimonas sedimenti]
MPPTVPPADAASSPEPEQRFRTLFEQAPFSVQLLSAAGRTLMVNQAWKDLWGTQEGDPLLRWVLSEYDMLADPQLEAKGVTPYLRRAFAGEPVRIPAAWYDPAEIGKPGRARWVEATARPIKAADGSVLEVMLIHEDVTERFLAERQLRASEMRLRQLANTIPQLAWIADAEGVPQWYNDRWYEYTGTTPEEMRGDGWQSVPHPEVLPHVIERWAHSVATGEPFQMTVPMRGRDGTHRPFFTLVAPLRDDTGQVVQWFGTNTDVSPLHDAEQVRQEGERRKDEFLAMLAHELRNPLAPISTAAQLLRHAGAAPDLVLRAGEVIERQVRHMTKLVDDLLDVSRVTRGLVTLHMDTLDLAGVVSNALEQMQPLLQASGRSVAQPPGLERIHVRGDRIRLVQVLVNLLNNAIKYSPPGSPIQLQVSVAEGQVSISVGDEGIGIDPAFQPHVFELFTQAQRAPDRSQGGLGIGLALVKSLVQLHGGEVKVDSQGLGQGSVFTVTLPLVADAVPQAPQPAERGPASSRGLRIMVVDDNADAADTLAALLEIEGHDVRTAGDATAALEIAHGFAADVLILDIGLPGIDGYQLARLLRKQFAAATFIALTGYGQDKDRELSRQAGFDLHLVKPLDPRLLQAALRGVAPPARS